MYKQKAKAARLKVLEMIFKAQTSHIGSNFSVADIMTVLFDKMDLDKDKVVLSAGWKAAMLYYFLWTKERITKKELDSYCQTGSKFIGLAEPMHPDLSIAGGSMGMGLPGSVGIALAKKLKGEKGKVYCIMSDGEQAIGTTWESALIAIHHKLNNLIVIVDYNGLQAMGKTNEVLNIEPLREKWKAFGWDTDEIDGHNYKEIEEALVNEVKKPVCIIAHTIKGKGVSFMENNNLYHYKNLGLEEYEASKKELGKVRQSQNFHRDID